MVYVTSDLHGRMDCLKKLLDYIHFNDDEDNWLLENDEVQTLMVSKQSAAALSVFASACT